MSAASPLSWACRTDVGRERQINEDSHGELRLPDGSVLLVVADGMGGHQAGEVASRIAVEAITQIAERSPSDDPREKLRNGFVVANQRILAEAARIGAEGMGTTAVAVYVRPDGRAYVAHVGDSRLYHVQDGLPIRATKDHTRVQRMVDMGIIGPDEAKHHPDANVVTRALGHAKLADGKTLEPEVREAPIQLGKGDALVLCSDGLYDDLTDEEIASGLARRTADEAARVLIELANQRGGHDNITVATLYFGTQVGVAPRVAPRPAERPRRITSPDGPAVAPTGPAANPRKQFLLGGLVALAGVLVIAVVVLLARRGPGPVTTGTSPPPDLAVVAPGPARVDAATHPDAGVHAAHGGVKDGGAATEKPPSTDGGAGGKVAPAKDEKKGDKTDGKKGDKTDGKKGEKTDGKKGDAKKGDGKKGDKKDDKKNGKTTSNESAPAPSTEPKTRKPDEPTTATTPAKTQPANGTSPTTNSPKAPAAGAGSSAPAGGSKAK